MNNEAGPPLPFPWDEAMAFGFGVLRLSPAEFWSMSLPELAAAMRGTGGRETNAAPPDRETLAMLMRLSPDFAPD